MSTSPRSSLCSRCFSPSLGRRRTGWPSHSTYESRRARRWAGIIHLPHLLHLLHLPHLPHVLYVPHLPNLPISSASLACSTSLTLSSLTWPTSPAYITSPISLTRQVVARDELSRWSEGAHGVLLPVIEIHKAPIPLLDSSRALILFTLEARPQT